MGKEWEEFLKTTEKKSLGRIAAATGLILGGLAGCASEETKTPVSLNPSRPTQVKPTDIPPSPTITFEKPTSEPTLTEVPTPVPLPTLEPTPTIEAKPAPAVSIEMGFSGMAIGAENDILNIFEILRLPVYKNQIESKNPGIKLLTPEGSSEQFFVQLQKDGQTLISGNWNLPVYPETSQYQPVFNTFNFVQLMGYVDNEGNWFFHIPIQPGEEEEAPVVFMKEEKLQEGLANLIQNGFIEPESVKNFWQPIPEEAVKAVMSKFEDAIYVTFYDKDERPITFSNEEIGDQKAELVELNDGKGNSWTAIKVCDLPVEPTPIPPTVTSTKKPSPHPTLTPEPVELPPVSLPDLRQPQLNDNDARVSLNGLTWRYVLEPNNYEGGHGKFLGFKIEGDKVLIGIDCDKGPGGEREIIIPSQNAEIFLCEVYSGEHLILVANNPMILSGALKKYWVANRDPIIAVRFDDGHSKLIFWRTAY